MHKFDVVTGAFGYTGKYITRRLLSAGRRVRTLTGHPDRENPFGRDVEVAPLDFAHPEALANSLRRADVLFNTYWVRFNHGRASFDDAVRNSAALIHAARKAGVRKIVHISIANPSLDSPLPYYSGKSRVERHIIESGLAHSILRPTVIFGPEGILINNIAWFVRHLPFFAIPGSGQYQIQPVLVDDVAELACDCALQEHNSVQDAVGPEIFSFDDLVRTIAAATHSRTLLFRVSPKIALSMIRLIEPFIGDVILTQEEIEGLVGNLLVSKGPATGRTRFSEWLSGNASMLGTRYLSELRTHYREPRRTTSGRQRSLTCPA